MGHYFKKISELAGDEHFLNQSFNKRISKKKTNLNYFFKLNSLFSLKNHWCQFYGSSQESKEKYISYNKYKNN